MKKNYRLRDLLLDKDSMLLLNEIALQLNMKNSDFARILLTKQLREIKAEGLENYTLAIVGHKKAKK